MNFIFTSLKAGINALTHQWLRLSDQKKKRVARVLACVMTLVICLEPSVAHAQGVDNTTKILNDINVYANMLLRTLSAIFWPILLLIGSLLDNSLIFGGSMEDRLLSAWVEIRNLVNIVFVVILVVIALYNVLGLGQDKLPLGYKTIIGKFVLALILVNFSFTGVKVILDVSNVVTGAVFALPAKTIDENALSKEMEKRICGKRAKEIPIYDKWCTDSQKFNSEALAYFSRLDRNNIAVVYAIRYGKATELKFIREGIKDIGQLGFNIIFNVILFVIYTVGYIALFLILASRLVVIWIALVLSPLYALSLVIPISSITGDASDVGTKLKGTIIAPISIGLALSVGYIMLDALSANTSVDPILVSTNLTSLDPNALPTDINTLQELLIAVGSIIIIWKGTFDAAKNTFVSGIVGKMEEGIRGAGTWVAKLPLYAQWIPIKAPKSQKGEENYSLADLNFVKAQYMQNAGGLNPDRRQQLLQDFGFATGSMSSAQQAELAGYLKKNDTSGLINAINHLPQAFKNEPGWRSILENLKTNKSQYGLGDQEIKKLEGAGSAQEGTKVLSEIINTNPKMKDILSKAGYKDGAAFLNKIENAVAGGEAGEKVEEDMDKIIEALSGGQSDAGQTWKSASYGGDAKDTLGTFAKSVDKQLVKAFTRLSNAPAGKKQLIIDKPILDGQGPTIKRVYEKAKEYFAAKDQPAKDAALKELRDEKGNLSQDTLKKIFGAVQGATPADVEKLSQNVSVPTPKSNGPEPTVRTPKPGSEQQ